MSVVRLRGLRVAAHGVKFRISAEALEDRVLPAVTIVIDYSLDSGFFAAQARKDAIEAVAAELSVHLAGDTLAAIPAGTYEIADPRAIGTPGSRVNVNFTVGMGAANTFRIFVSGAPLAGDTAGQAGPEINTAARDFDFQTDFAPFAGAAGFDNDGTTVWDFAANVTSDDTNFRLVARHELLHALGIGTAQSWEAKIVANAFTGARARAANGGVNPAVTDDGDGSHGHFAAGVNSIMQPTAGSITHLTAIDIATLADIGWTPASTAGTYADVFGRTAGGAWMVSRNAGGLAAPTAFGQWAESAGWRDVSQGDFNRDGLTDVAGRSSGGLWYVGLNSGTAFVNTYFGRWAPESGDPQNATWRDVRFGDFNGDLRTDVAGRASNGQWYVGLSNGTSFATTLWAGWNELAQWRDVRVGDFDGDTRADLAGRASNGQWYVARSTGTAFTTGLWAGWNELALWRDVLVADFDSNGRADLAGRASNGEWYVGLSIGGGATNSFSTLRWAGWNEAAGWRGVTVGDFAGDGRLDILGRTSGGQFYVAQNVGGSSFGTIPFGRWNEGDWRTVLVGDFAGSTLRADILGRAADGSWWLGENNGTGLTFRQYGAWNEALGWRDVMSTKKLFPAAAPGAGATQGIAAGLRAASTTDSVASAPAAGAAFAPVRSATADVIAALPAEESDEEPAALPPAFAGAERADLFHAVFADGGLADALVAA